MHAGIVTVYDTERGCGWRDEGGMYLRGGSGFNTNCGKMPLPLDRPCFCCGNGILPEKIEKDGTRRLMLPRSLQRIDAIKLFQDAPCKNDSARCNLCLVNNLQGRTCFLIGVGESHYKSPSHFVQEALALNPITGEENGISKRIANIPNDLVVSDGELEFHMVESGKPKPSVIFLAHPSAIVNYKSEIGSNGEHDFNEEDGAEVLKQVVKVPGVVAIFRPTRVEYVVKGDETDEYIEGLIKRGITPVHVVRVEENGKQLELEGIEEVEEM